MKPHFRRRCRSSLAHPLDNHGSTGPALPLIRIYSQRLIRFLHEHARPIGTFVDDDLHHHSALGGSRANDSMRLYRPPLTARAPVAIEIGIAVLRIFLQVLLPGRIVEVDAVRPFVVLLLECNEKPVHRVLLWPVAVHPAEHRKNQDRPHDESDLNLAPLFFRGIVLLRVQQCHPSSITDSGATEKVPEALGIGIVPSLHENPAPEGRSSLAQRFSAGKLRRHDSSPGGTTEFSRTL